LTPTERYVAIALADYGERIHPSLAHLCAKTGLHRNTLSRAICSMRAKGIIRTYGTGKALTYTLDMHFKGDGTVPFKVTHRTFKGDAPSPLKVRDPNYQRTTKEPPAADAANGGREGFDELVQRIRVRDPRADIDAQRRVCSRVMEQHGLAGEDIPPAWRLLCLNWARTGNAPYDTLQRIVTSLEGARDVRAVVLHKIKGVAA